MAGRVLGSAFRFVLQSLMGAELLLPELRARVDAVRDDGWASWEDYVTSCNDVAALLEPETVVRVGEGIMSSARPLLERQGFATAEAALHDWRAVFLANVRDLAETSVPRTIDVAEGHAIIDYPLELPAPLIEGFLRGVVLAYGRRVEAFESVRWREEGRERLRCLVRFV